MITRDESLRDWYVNLSRKGSVWISDATGQIHDTYDLHSRISAGEGGCSMCHEPPLDYSGIGNGAILSFDEDDVPQIVDGNDVVCGECIEWVGYVRHYKLEGSQSRIRFELGRRVIAVGTADVYRVEAVQISGVPKAFFPLYQCTLVESNPPTDHLLQGRVPFADFELQPAPPRVEQVAAVKPVQRPPVWGHGRFVPLGDAISTSRPALQPSRGRVMLVGKEG